MVAILEMDLEVPDRGFGTGRVELAWAIVAADTWEPLVFDVWRERVLECLGGDGRASCGVDCSITHEALE